MLDGDTGSPDVEVIVQAKSEPDYISEITAQSDKRQDVKAEITTAFRVMIQAFKDTRGHMVHAYYKTILEKKYSMKLK